MSVFKYYFYYSPVAHLLYESAPSREAPAIARRGERLLARGRDGTDVADADVAALR